MSIQEPKPNYNVNPSQRTPCILVLDASGSMDGEPIDQLNQGVRALEVELKNDATASMSVQLAIVCVGGPAGDADIMQDWTDAGDFSAFDLTAGGYTPLGQGMEIALNMVEEQKEILRSSGISYTRPWIFMISDGVPTDEWRDTAARCRDAEENRKCVIFPIAVEGSDIEILSQFSSNPPKELNGLRFVELFQWLSSSLRGASRTAPGEAIQLPSTDAWAAVDA